MATGYTGTVHFTSSDAQAVLPSDYTFTAADAGAHLQRHLQDGRAARAVTATDTVDVRSPARHRSRSARRPIGHLSSTVPRRATASPAGNSLTVTVTALGRSSATLPPATPARSISSAATAGRVLPARLHVAAADGTATFSDLQDNRPARYTATDTGRLDHRRHQHDFDGQPGGRQPPPRSRLRRRPRRRASPLSVTVTARDAFGNIATGYTGTVHFTSSDGQAALPADYTFTAADAGVHTFTATLKTAGSQTITATDTVTATITGTQPRSRQRGCRGQPLGDR